jgi:DNA-binding XRE family transcriptional regulator
VNVPQIGIYISLLAELERAHLVSENVPAMQTSERPQPALGLAIQQLRIKRGATQKDIADATGLTRRTLSYIEHGHANPTWATLKDIADALEIKMSDLAKVAEQVST